MDGFEGVGFESGGTGGVGDSGATLPGSGGQQGNPAWNEFYQAVPQEYHDKVTPLLQKWDQGVQERFQKVHSEYEPWKPVIQTGVTPQDVMFGLNVLDVLQNNPQYIYNALKEQHKFDQEPPNGSSNGQGQEDLNNQEFKDPRFDELQSNFDKLARAFVTRYEAEQQEIADAQADEELNTELQALKKQFGDFDEDYVVSKMLNADMTGEQAVQAYQKMINGIISQGPRPMFLGAGSGAFPGNDTDVRKLSNKQADDVAIQMLLQAAQEKNQ
jgi:hypothetical protein